MTPRLTSRMLVSALVRRANASGGSAMVLRHGDDGAGTVLLLCQERGRFTALLECVADLGDGQRWARCGPETDDAQARDAYLERRRKYDPDLWLVELDVEGAERLAADIVGAR